MYKDDVKNLYYYFFSQENAYSVRCVKG